MAALPHLPACLPARLALQSLCWRRLCGCTTRAWCTAAHTWSTGRPACRRVRGWVAAGAGRRAGLGAGGRAGGRVAASTLLRLPLCPADQIECHHPTRPTLAFAPFPCLLHSPSGSLTASSTPTHPCRSSPASRVGPGGGVQRGAGHALLLQVPRGGCAVLYTPCCAVLCCAPAVQLPATDAAAGAVPAAGPCCRCCGRPVAGGCGHSCRRCCRCCRCCSLDSRSPLVIPPQSSPLSFSFRLGRVPARGHHAARDHPGRHGCGGAPRGRAVGAALRRAALCPAVPCCAVLCCAVLCCAARCCLLRPFVSFRRACNPALRLPECTHGPPSPSLHRCPFRSYKHLVGREAVVPQSGRRIRIIADEYVDREFGTGALKITPGGPRLRPGSWAGAQFGWRCVCPAGAAAPGCHVCASRRARSRHGGWALPCVCHVWVRPPASSSPHRFPPTPSPLPRPLQATT